MEKNISENIDKNKKSDYHLSTISYKSMVSVLSNYLNTSLFLTGDFEGKICLWDLRLNKAVKYVNTGYKNKIK